MARWWTRAKLKNGTRLADNQRVDGVFDVFEIASLALLESDALEAGLKLTRASAVQATAYTLASFYSLTSSLTSIQGRCVLAEDSVDTFARSSFITWDDGVVFVSYDGATNVKVDWATTNQSLEPRIRSAVSASLFP